MITMTRKKDDDARKGLEEFLKTHAVAPSPNKDVETRNLDRNILHTITVNDFHQFDGKFGDACVINYTTTDGETFKAYIGGYEVVHFRKYADEQEMPFTCHIARTQQESAQNPERLFNRLTIGGVE